MNEYIEVMFRRNGKPWRIKRELPEGIELDEPDPIPRTVSVGWRRSHQSPRPAEEAGEDGGRELSVLHAGLVH